jgi:hypothetical protein
MVRPLLPPKPWRIVKDASSWHPIYIDPAFYTFRDRFDTNTIGYWIEEFFFNLGRVAPVGFYVTSPNLATVRYHYASADRLRQLSVQYGNLPGRLPSENFAAHPNGIDVWMQHRVKRNHLSVPGQVMIPHGVTRMAGHIWFTLHKRWFPEQDITSNGYSDPNAGRPIYYPGSMDGIEVYGLAGCSIPEMIKLRLWARTWDRKGYDVGWLAR